MDTHVATGLFHSHGVVLCLDAPTDSTLEFGIDTNSWVTGPQFKGIKLIPPGIHYIFYSVKSRHGGASAPRTSAFLNFERGQTFVLRWSASLEQFEFLSRDDASPYVASVRNFEFDTQLGAYPAESEEHWKSLSFFLTAPLVSRLQPIGAQLTATGKALTNEEKRQIDEALEDMGIQETETLPAETQCYYTAIPSAHAALSKPYSPAQLTALHMDKTAILERMILDAYAGDEKMFLGELQFSFLCFLLGQSFEAFEQWKRLVSLALTCEASVYDTARRGKFWLALLQVLKQQLEEAPEDFFLDIVEGNNFLHHSLCDFFEITSDERTSEEIQERAEHLKSFVEDRFGIPFDFAAAQGEEDMPTIVEM